MLTTINYHNLSYNILLDICNTFSITRLEDTINLGELYKLLDMQSRYYDSLFDTKTNMYLKNHIIQFRPISRITLLDKVTCKRFDEVSAELLTNHVKGTIISTETIEEDLKEILTNKGNPALLGTNYNSYIDPLGTHKSKTLAKLHNIRVDNSNKQMANYFKRIEKDLHVYRGFNSNTYNELKTQFIISNSSDLTKRKLQQYVDFVTKPVEELKTIYGERKVTKLLYEFNLEFKITHRAPRNIAEIQKEIKDVIIKNVTQRELTLIINNLESHCKKFGTIDINRKIYRELLNALSYCDFFERASKLFTTYYKVDVIECLIVAHTAVAKGKVTCTC